MNDPLATSREYRERAVACRKKALLSASEVARVEYEKLAVHYDEIAVAELKLANAERMKKAN